MSQQHSPSKLSPTTSTTSPSSSYSNLPPLSMALSGLLNLSEVAGSVRSQTPTNDLSSARVTSHPVPSPSAAGSDRAIVQ